MQHPLFVIFFADTLGPADRKTISGHASRAAEFYSMLILFGAAIVAAGIGTLEHVPLIPAQERVTLSTFAGAVN